jgi:hypothetical protein
MLSPSSIYFPSAHLLVIIFIGSGFHQSWDVAPSKNEYIAIWMLQL